MLSLAAIRYRRVLASEGGPIDRIDMGEIAPGGRRSFIANAWLRRDCALWDRDGRAPAKPHGSGVDTSPMVARFKAVSEALERWAHMAVLESERRGQYGFDVDPSSNGMAAFPGLFARQARPAALLEACERFNLIAWWEGRLAARLMDTPWLGVQAVVIQSAVPGVTVVLCHRAADGFYSYGHAAAADLAAARERALLEMERHEHQLRRRALVPAGGVAPSAETHVLERRSRYFSTEEGHERFLARATSRAAAAPAAPRVAFDGPIPGTWTRYADVWRVAFEPPSLHFMGRSEDYFFL